MVIEIGNPTLPNLKEEIMSKTINKWAKTHAEILNTFLAEYMEVNGVEESELKNRVQLVQTPEGVFVREDEKTTLLEINWGKVLQEPGDYSVKYTIVMTTILTDKVKYPKTDAFLKQIEGNDTKYEGIEQRSAPTEGAEPPTDNANVVGGVS